MVGKGGRGRKQKESNQVRGTGTDVTMVEVGPASVREGAARCPLPRCAVGWDAPAEKQGPWMLLGQGGSSSPELVGWFVVVGRGLADGTGLGGVPQLSARWRGTSKGRDGGVTRCS